MPDVASIMPLPNATGPSFQDIFNNFQSTLRNSPTFNEAYNKLTPTAPGVLDPGNQKMIDQIRSNANFYGTQAGSAASALASRRGLPGSSVEQFGVQTALNNVNRTSADQEAQVWMQNLQRQQQLQDAQANSLFGLTGMTAPLASDETASLRNQAFQQQMLQLQQQLGQQGIDVANRNVDQSGKNAQTGGLYNLLGALGPTFLSRMFPGAAGPGGAGGGGGIFNIGGGNGFLGLGGSGAATVGGIPYGGGGSPASSLFPGGLGPVGTMGPGGNGMFGAGGSLFNTAGTSGFGAGNILPGLAGWRLGTSAFGDNRYSNYGGVAGAGLGSLFGPLGSAAGGFLGAGWGSLSDKFDTSVSKKLGNTAGSIVRYANPVTAIPNVASKVTSAVKSVFPF